MNRNLLHNHLLFTSGYLLEGEGDPGAAAPTPTAQPPAAATPAAPVPQAATPLATPQAPATGAPDGWVPSFRLRETREAATREAQAEFARERARYEQELNQYKTNLQRLAGVTPQNPQDTETDAVRQQFAKLYPGLAKLEERAQDLQGLMDRGSDMESQVEHYWQNYGRQMVDRLFDHASKSMGAPLTEEAKRVMHSSFVGFLQQSPELQARYESDPTIVEDFWKSFSASFIDPVRRTASAGVVNRAAGIPSLPQDAPSGLPTPNPGPKPANLDDRVALGWAQYQQNARK